MKKRGLAHLAHRYRMDESRITKAVFTFFLQNKRMERTTNDMEDAAIMELVLGGFQDIKSYIYGCWLYRLYFIGIRSFGITTNFQHLDTYLTKSGLIKSLHILLVKVLIFVQYVQK